MRKIRIGTRRSRLAMIQAGMVARAIEDNNPDLQTELVPMQTTGDQILTQSLDKIGGKGLFVKELDQALLDGQVDIAVHSAKDLPTELDPRLPIVAVSKREDPRDVLVLPAGVSAMDPSKPVGCSSARRRIQLGRLMPETEVAPVRGNVLTRLSKLDSGQYSALVLAAAGLKRLGLEERISQLFDIDEMLPSACQGILAIQARQGDRTDYLSAFHDENSLHCFLTERAFIRTLDGGCSKPCAAHAVWQGDALVLHGMYVSDDERTVKLEAVCCAPETAQTMAVALAERMRYE